MKNDAEKVATVIELPEPIDRPNGWAEADDSVMTNFDHTIDEDMVAVLLSQPLYAQHSAWEFCGYVWHAEGVWFETACKRFARRVVLLHRPRRPETPCERRMGMGLTWGRYLERQNNERRRAS